MMQWPAAAVLRAVPSIPTNDTDYGFTVRKASEQLQISSTLLLFQAKNPIIATWRRIWIETLMTVA